MNHYRGNLTSRIQAGDKTRQGFFSPAQCRAFLQSGIACWLQGFPASVNEPCCDLGCVGGDGTSIGTSQKRGMHLRSIWTPLEPRAPSVKWGRNDRRPTAWSLDGHPDHLTKPLKPALETADARRQSVSACAFVLDILRSRNQAIPELNIVMESTQGLLSPIRNEFRRWCGLSRKSMEYEPLRHIIRVCVSNESVTGAIPQPLLTELTALLIVELNRMPVQERRLAFQKQLTNSTEVMLKYGIGSHILHVLQAQSRHSEIVNGSSMLSTTRSLLVHLAGATRTVFALIPAVNPLECRECVGCSLPAGHGVKYHNPAETGFDYNCFLKQGGGCERNSWPEPTEQGKFLFKDVSGTDCEKKRTMIIGHRARCSLWVWTCMIHQKVIGHHVIKRGEGKRDAIISLYRFKKAPPAMVFVDFACHAEECGLNWLAEYYKNVLFYHDTFHGYGHKCSSRFSCEGLSGMPATNTSIMEQFNAFLQPIRGILSSGKTRVSEQLGIQA